MDSQFSIAGKALWSRENRCSNGGALRSYALPMLRSSPSSAATKPRHARRSAHLAARVTPEPIHPVGPPHLLLPAVLTRRTDTLLDTATTTFPLPPQHPPPSFDSLGARPPAAAAAASLSFSLKTSLSLLLLLLRLPADDEAAAATVAGEVEPFFFLPDSAEALVLGEAEVFRLALLVSAPPPGARAP